MSKGVINQTFVSADALRPTVAEINLASLRQNLKAIRKAVAPARVMVVLKANAYGHGLVEVAQALVPIGVDYFGVAFLEEGILLRKKGIKTPILVLGGIIGNQIPLFIKHDISITASSIDKLNQIEIEAVKLRKRARVHLKIDTGMERLGVHYYSAEKLILATAACQHCEVEGIFSHFASSDSSDLGYARMQLARFQEVLAIYERHGIALPPLRHMANSGAILQIPDATFDMVRAGIMTYGIYPSDEVPRSIVIEPVLTLKSRVVYFKVTKAGHPVSYSGTWTSDRETRIVTIPTGYGDGYFRAMSNKAEVLIRGRRYPVVGNICMDQMMVNIAWDTAYNGDEVVLVGRQGDHSITCEELARWAGTIPYEVLTNINTRVPRVYLE